jgi:hypothetical protein
MAEGTLPDSWWPGPVAKDACRTLGMSACRHLSTAKRRRRPAARQSRDTDSPARSRAYAASLRDTNSVKGRIQREGEVVHLVANHLTDLSAELATVGQRDAGFPLPHGRGDEFHHGSPGIDPPAAEGPEAEGHLRAGPAHRQHQGEDPRFQVTRCRFETSRCSARPCVPIAVNIAHRCNKLSPQRTYCAVGLLVHQSLPSSQKMTWRYFGLSRTD